jgi:Domain of unknown function (DUF4262)
MLNLFEREWIRIRKQIREAIMTSQQSVQIVCLTEYDPPGSHPFMYTIGNYAHGLPELLLVGTDQRGLGGVLNVLGHIQRERGTAFADEELVSIGGQFPLRIVDAGETGRTKYATLVGKYYETRDYEVRQVLLCDTKGRWPDTPGCDLPYARHPILSKISQSKH